MRCTARFGYLADVNPDLAALPLPTPAVMNRGSLDVKIKEAFLCVYWLGDSPEHCWPHSPVIPGIPCLQQALR